MRSIRGILSCLVFVFTGMLSYGQNVPLGIFYQAVARDNFGKELVNRSIDVKFSILRENTLGTVVYEEVHSHITTSKFGVFSLVIGNGEYISGISGKLSQIDWSISNHFLKIEVNFGQGFIHMGTMQFLAVPYALYAQKSLEPGPQGPKGETGAQGLQGIQGLKGEQGNPATDDQTLSFDGRNLSLSGGNTVNLSMLNIPHQLSILGDTLSIMGGNKVSLTNQIQDLQLDVNNKLKINKNLNATEIDLTRFLDDKQQLTFNSVDNTLVITGGNNVNLSPMKQDLQLTSNILSITNKPTPAQIDLSGYLQNLNFTPADNKLQIIGGNTIDLTPLKNDADADPGNEIQDLSLTANKLKITNNASATEINLAPYLDNTDNQTISYNPSTYTLTLTNGGTVSIGNLITYRAKKNAPTSAVTPLSNVDFIPDELEYNDGGNFDPLTGEFIAPCTGVYTFDIKYIAPPSANGQMIMVYKNGNPYETLGTGIGSGTTLFRTLTIKLILGNKIKFVINTGVTVDIGTGSFSGFRVN